MKRLTIRYDDETLADLERIVRVCQAAGYSISRNAAYIAWLNHSDSLAANWLILPSDDHELFTDVAFSLRSKA